MAGSRKTSKAFDAHSGDISNVVRVGRTQHGVRGRFDTPRAEMGRTAALDILNDPDYRANLKKRMIAGEGGAIEVWIWRIGYGEPQKDDGEAEVQRQRFEAARAEVREYLKRNPQGAHILDAAAMGATRVLPRPQLVLKAPDEPA